MHPRGDQTGVNRVPPVIANASSALAAIALGNGSPCKDEPVLPEPPSAEDDAALDALTGSLESAHFTVEGIEERLGTNELSRRPIDTAVQLRRLEEEPFGTVAKLFLLGLPVDSDRLATALAPLELTRLAETGLLRLDATTALASAPLGPTTPLSAWSIFCSLPSRARRACWLRLGRSCPNCSSRCRTGVGRRGLPWWSPRDRCLFARPGEERGGATRLAFGARREGVARSPPRHRAKSRRRSPSRCTAAPEHCER